MTYNRKQAMLNTAIPAVLGVEPPAKAEVVAETLNAIYLQNLARHQACLEKMEDQWSEDSDEQTEAYDEARYEAKERRKNARAIYRTVAVLGLPTETIESYNSDVGLSFSQNQEA